MLVICLLLPLFNAWADQETSMLLLVRLTCIKNPIEASQGSRFLWGQQELAHVTGDMEVCHQGVRRWFRKQGLLVRQRDGKSVSRQAGKQM